MVHFINQLISVSADTRTSLVDGRRTNSLSSYLYGMARQFLAMHRHGQWRSTTPFDDVTESESDDEGDSDLPFHPTQGFIERYNTRTICSRQLEKMKSKTRRLNLHTHIHSHPVT